jgi:predicted dehydrogenase
MRLLGTKRSTEGLRVGFVGAGGISSVHAQILKLVPEATLAAVCDTAFQRAQDLAREFDIPEAYSSTDTMFRKARLDAVHVLTPPQYHVDVAVECLRAGCHVLVEKPLGLSVADCEKLRAETEESRLICGVNHNLTHIPVVERLVAAIRSRRLGRVNHVLMNFCAPPAYVPLSDPGNYMFQRPENMIFEFAPHPFSVIRLLMGGVVRAECLASGERELSGGKRFFRSWQISLECERGTASLYLSLGQGVQDISVHVLGQDGTANADLVRGILRVTETSPRRVAGPLQEGWAHGTESFGTAIRNVGHQYGAALGRLSSRRRDPFYRSFAAFYQALAAGKSPREDVSAGKAVVEFCEETVRHVKFATATQEIPADVANG